MGVPYWLVLEQVRSFKDAIAKGEPVEVEVRDNDQWNWFKARALVSDSPIPGGGAAALMAPWGEIVEEGKWYVKVLEELPVLD